jgi:hypothetical protein
MARKRESAEAAFSRRSCRYYGEGGSAEEHRHFDLVIDSSFDIRI